MRQPVGRNNMLKKTGVLKTTILFISTGIYRRE